MGTLNPFYVDQCVVCIYDKFPVVFTTGDKSRIGTLDDCHPVSGEVLSVDEILGEYLRFDKYDCNDESHPDYGRRWFKHTHFRPATESETEDYYQKVAIFFIDTVFGSSRKSLKVEVNVNTSK